MAGLDRRSAIRTIGRAGLAVPVIAQLGCSKDATGTMVPETYGEANTLDAAHLPDMAHASIFGARFDGVTDDSIALQRAIDVSAERGQMLILPSGTAILSHPLDLRYRNLAIRGQVMNGTKLRAGRKMPTLINAAADRDQIMSPLVLSDMSLEGAGLVDTCLSLAHRHHSVLANLFITGAKVGVLERAMWLSRRSNCRVSDHVVGWRLAGENNSSHWQGCTFTNCKDVHLDIGGGPDGNVALLFQNCDIEFGAGHGAQIAAGVEATFDSCYLGEGLAGDTLRNAGTATMRGGALFFGGNQTALGVRIMPGGNTRFDGSQLNGTRFGGLEQLLAADDPTRSGRISFSNVKANLQTGGNPVVLGDVIGSAPVRNYVPRLGRDWVATADKVVIQGGVATPNTNARTVACGSSPGTGGLFGLAGRLVGTDWQEGRPLMILLAYSATHPVHVRLSHASHGAAPAMDIGTLPPSPSTATYIKIDVPARREDYRFLELFAEAAPNASMTLFRATLSDNGFLGEGAGSAFTNLAHGQ